MDDNQINFYEQKLQFEIDAWDLNQAIKNSELIKIIDVRSTEAYLQEHIPGAINFPHKKIDIETAKNHLDPSILYITYCDGIGCNASTKGALKLSQLGYQVKELMGGIEWWKRDGYPITSLHENKELNDYSHYVCGCD